MQARVLTGVLRRALELVPAVVLARQSHLPRREEVDLLLRVLPDIADVEGSRRPVEREPPGVPQAVADDRPAVGTAPQELAEPRAEVLGALRRIATASPVAE